MFGLYICYCSNDPAAPDRSELIPEIYHNMKDGTFKNGGIVDMGGGNHWDTSIMFLPSYSKEQEDELFKINTLFYKHQNKYLDHPEWYVFRSEEIKSYVDPEEHKPKKVIEIPLNIGCPKRNENGEYELEGYTIHQTHYPSGNRDPNCPFYLDPNEPCVFVISKNKD
jgi:hypothetical protein